MLYAVRIGDAEWVYPRDHEQLEEFLMSQAPGYSGPRGIVIKPSSLWQVNGQYIVSQRAYKVYHGLVDDRQLKPTQIVQLPNGMEYKEIEIPFPSDFDLNLEVCPGDPGRRRFLYFTFQFENETYYVRISMPVSISLANPDEAKRLAAFVINDAIKGDEC